MAKYEVKDINKNGKIDGWEQAKYDAINKSSEKESPLDFFGGNIAASIGAANNAMAQDAQQIVQPMTNVPPAPSNTVGNARPVFSLPVQQNAEKMFGNTKMMQNAVAAPPLFKKKCNKKKY
tara:strand:- start:1923 stop:2285 length:363 start_codon:yes stop_codon:yes gene_type:complete